ncbi:putative F-box protein [Namao virus]|nr:putative F-box protein [Namao virus]
MWSKILFDIFEKISFQLSEQDLNNCRYVCQWWRFMASNDLLWIRRCIFDNVCCKEVPENWRYYYIVKSKERNLMKTWDPCESYTKSTKTLLNGESMMIHTLVQDIDLFKLGYYPYILNNIKPDLFIKFEGMTNRNPDCYYVVNIKLISKDYKVLAEYTKSVKNIYHLRHHTWRRFIYTFHNYPKGVRHIKVKHSIFKSLRMCISGLCIKLIYPKYREERITKIHEDKCHGNTLKYRTVSCFNIVSCDCLINGYTSVTY